MSQLNTLSSWLQWPRKSPAVQRVYATIICIACAIGLVLIVSSTIPAEWRRAATFVEVIVGWATVVGFGLLFRVLPIVVGGFALIVAALVTDTSNHAALVADMSNHAASVADMSTHTNRDRTAVVLAVNDIYRIEGRDGGRRGGLARLRTLRRQLEQRHEVLLLHAGDVVSPSLLGGTYHGRQMIDVLNLTDGKRDVFDNRMLVVLGNHEFDESDCQRPDVLADRLAESEFTWVGANIHFDRCPSGGRMMDTPTNVKLSTLVTIGGIRIGVFGLTTDLSGRKPYPAIGGPGERLELARSLSEELRKSGAEAVVALTHLGRNEDEAILRAFGRPSPNGRQKGPDLIIGGHDHERMAFQVNGRWVLKADADAISAKVVRIVIGSDGQLRITPDPIELDGTVEIDESIAEDPEVKTQIDRWLSVHEQHLCAGQSRKPDCLSEQIATVREQIIGDENAIRSSETNLGTWIAEVMRKQLAADRRDPECWVPEVAIINAGAIRLNANIAESSPFSRRHVEEMFPFAGTEVVLAQIKAAALKVALENSLRRRGTGAWLQAAGLRVWVGQDRTGELRVRRAYVLKNNALVDLDELIKKEADLTIATLTYLTNVNEDGYDLQPKTVDCLAGTRGMKDRMVSAAREAAELRLRGIDWMCTLPEKIECVRKWGLTLPNSASDRD